jgi:hypothetical protein
MNSWRMMPPADRRQRVCTPRSYTIGFAEAKGARATQKEARISRRQRNLGHACVAVDDLWRFMTEFRFRRRRKALIVERGGQ